MTAAELVSLFQERGYHASERPGSFGADIVVQPLPGDALNPRSLTLDIKIQGVVFNARHPTDIAV